MARSAAAAGDLPKAIDAYRAAIRQNPEDKNLRLELAELSHVLPKQHLMTFRKATTGTDIGL